MVADPSQTARREEVLRQVAESVRADIQHMEDRIFMGLPACRTFVCQGCGKALSALHGSHVKCRCGVTSAAEVLK